MLGMDGLEVLKRIRTSSSMPVLITSARNFIAEKAMGLGVSDFISKPFTRDYLIKKIQDPSKIYCNSDPCNSFTSTAYPQNEFPHVKNL